MQTAETPNHALCYPILTSFQLPQHPSFTATYCASLPKVPTHSMVVPRRTCMQTGRPWQSCKLSGRV